MSETILNKKKSKSSSKLLIFGFIFLLIISAAIAYFFFIKPNEWLIQKSKSIEVGTNVQICDLINCTDEVLVAYHPKPAEPYPLGKLDITFEVTKGEDSKDITFTYIVVDTTAPIMERTNSQIAIGEEVDLSNYIKVTDNSGEDLISKVSYQTISTATLGDFSTELSVKDSSGNESKYVFKYSIVETYAIAPDLPGTIKVMQFINGLNRMTYVAETGNPYGVTAGLYVGEFRKEVTFEGIEVGGVVLIPKVVEKLLADRDGKAIFIPADISEINNIDPVILSLESISYKAQVYNDELIRIDTCGNLVSISNVITDSQINNRLKITPGVFTDNIINGITPIIENQNNYAFMIIGNFSFNEIYENYAFLGQKMTETNKVFGLRYLAKNDNWFRSIKEGEILKIGSSIVFMKDVE